MEAAWPSWRRDPHEYSGLVFFGLLAPFLHRLLPEERARREHDREAA